MKRHISIFAFLLCAFAAVGSVGAARGALQTVSGGYYYIGNEYKGLDLNCMSPSYADNLTNQTVTTFTAKPRKGLEVVGWAKCIGEYYQSKRQNLKPEDWTNTDSKTYDWKTVEAEGNGEIVVRFDYITFDITFDSKGGVPDKIDAVTDQTIDSPDISLPTVTRNGWDFTGWKNGKGKIFTGTFCKCSDFWYENSTSRGFDASLTAQWNGKTYSITFDLDGGTGGSCPSAYTVTENSQGLEITPPTKEGHTIQGWTVDGATGGSPTVAGSPLTLTIPRNTYGNLTLTPNWQADTFTITYKPGSGTPGEEYTDTKTWGVSRALRDKTYTDPKGQYVQDGWNTTKESFEGTADYGLKAAYTDNADITLYPHWKLNGYKLTIHHKGAYYDGKLLEETALESLVVGTTNLNEILVAVPTNDAAFYGYYSTEGGSTKIYDEHGKCCKVEGIWSETWAAGGTFEGSADLEVWAKWGPPPEHCTISAVCDPAVGGTVEPASTNVVKGEDVTLTAEENPGYSFWHWTNSNGVVVSENHHGTFTVTNNATYIAVFTGNVYRVSFDIGDYDGDTPRAINVQFGKPYGHLPSVNYDDPSLIFTRWLDEMGNVITENSKVSISKKHILYADDPEVRSKFDVVWVDPSGKNAWVTNQDVSVDTRFEQADPKTASWSAKRDYKYWIKGWNPALPVTVVGDTTITAVWESYADVLDCPGLEFNVHTNWFVDTTPEFHKEEVGDSCLKLTNIGGDDFVSVKVTEPGEFTFNWKAGSTETALYVNEPGGGGKAQSYVVKSANTWTPVTIKVSEASKENPAEIRFSPDKTEFRDYLALDAVTWTPGVVPQKRTITVDAGEHGSATGGGSFDVGADVTLTATADPGYAFCCWTNDTGFATNENPWAFKVVDGAAYTATFTACVYRVTLNPSGGEGGVVEVQATFGEAMPALESLPQLEHSTFLGYFDAATDGKRYYNADGTSAATWDKMADTELFAQWSEDGKIVITVASGDTARGTASGGGSYYAGDNVMISATPNAGYAFQRWSDGSTAANFEIRVTTNASYTATFTARVYRVTFDANGGAQPTPEAKDVAFNEKYGTLAETSRSGYDFAGWWTKQSGGEEVTADSVFTTAGDQTLYAHWDEDIGELSRILDCTNLKFVEDVAGWSKYTEDFKAGDSCLRTVTKDAKISAKITTGGTLTFWWRGKADKRGGAAELLVKCGTQSRTCIVAPAEGENGWTQVTIENVVMDVGADKIEFSCTKSGEYLAIDFVTWTPEGGGEPTRGDPVEVTAAGVENGVFSLTIWAESEKDYGVWTNADLTIDSWGLMGKPQPGEGKPLEFKWTILPELPQLFFRAHEVE